MSDVYVYFGDFPHTVRAFVVASGDDFTIYLNSRNSFEQNQLSYMHELEHIRRGDFSRVLNVNRLESLRHAL